MFDCYTTEDSCGELGLSSLKQIVSLSTNPSFGYILLNNVATSTTPGPIPTEGYGQNRKSLTSTTTLQ